jgi:hypothetical protein
MTLKEHLAYGAAVTPALYPFFGLKSLFFFAASVLIDADHYIDYLYFGGFKSWSVRKMFRFHGQIRKWVGRPNICALEAFHTLEFYAGLLTVAVYFRSAEVYLILSGLLFHQALDLIRMRQWNALHLRALSFVEYWFRARKMRRSGIDPEGFFKEVYQAVSKPGAPEPNAKASMEIRKVPLSAQET